MLLDWHPPLEASCRRPFCLLSLDSCAWSVDGPRGPGVVLRRSTLENTATRARVPADLLYIQDILYNTYIQSEAPESSHTSATHVSYFESQLHVSARYRYPGEGWGEAHVSYL